MLKISRDEAFKSDVQALDDNELRMLVEGYIWELSHQFPVPGRPLGKNKQTGDLRGAYSLRFDIPGYPDRYRLVYAFRPNARSPESIHLIAVGLRFDDQVYLAAANRYKQSLN